VLGICLLIPRVCYLLPCDGRRGWLSVVTVARRSSRNTVQCDARRGTRLACLYAYEDKLSGRCEFYTMLSSNGPGSTVCQNECPPT
jgi:hypothetical protein